MNNYYRLNLPCSPIKESKLPEVLKLNQSESIKTTPWQIYKDPSEIIDILNVGVLNILTSVGLVPTTLVVFGMNTDVTFHRSYIHTDFLLSDNTKANPFAINFEINPSSTVTTHWWDTEGQESYQNNFAEDRLGRCYSKIPLKSNPKYLKLNKLESVTIQGNSTPLLFRTDVAHSVECKTTQGERFNVSLRFDAEKISSFADAVKLLETIIFFE